MMELLDGLDAAGLHEAVAALAGADPAQRRDGGAGGGRRHLDARRPDALHHLRRARSRDGPEPELAGVRLSRADRALRRRGRRRSSRSSPSGDELTLEADVCIVGSGAGGGVIAGELAKAGLKVCVVEAAGYFNESDFNQLELSAYENMYWRGGPQPTADFNVTVYAGAGLGGGTVINWTNCLRTRPWVREQWATEHGLEGVDGPDYDRHLDAIFERLSVNDRCSDLNGPHQRMKEGADALGWSCADDPAQHRRELLRPGIGRLHRLRRPVGLEAQHAADLPAGRVRRRRRHRRALQRRARAGRERPRGGGRGHVDRSGDRSHGPRHGARPAGGGRGRVARVARAADALADRRARGRELSAHPSLHGAVRHVRRGPGGVVGPAAGRPRGRVRRGRGRLRLPRRDDAVRARAGRLRAAVHDARSGTRR